MHILPSEGAFAEGGYQADMPAAIANVFAGELFDMVQNADQPIVAKPGQQAAQISESDLLDAAVALGDASHPAEVDDLISLCGVQVRVSHPSSTGPRWHRQRSCFPTHLHAWMS